MYIYLRLCEVVLQTNSVTYRHIFDYYPSNYPIKPIWPSPSFHMGLTEL